MKTKIGSFLRNNILTVIGVILGMIGGYFYWMYIGCNSGTCPITSSPLNSSLWGATMGGLFLSIFQTKKK
ncbi:MAG: DUF6132 family protein [Bacteroidales bacterium]